MQRTIMTGVLGLCFLYPGSPVNAQAVQDQAAQEKTAELQRQAADIVKTFAGRLKPRLVHALKQGGPVEAITVCSTVAPQIARQLSEETGWQVKRVSLKPRNRKTAVPDDWERATLASFDSRRAAGEPPSRLHAWAVVNGRFRYMQAQGVQPICLTCHGTHLDPVVKQALKQHYPGDQATGYSLGQLRGAFSLTRLLKGVVEPSP